MLIHAHKSLLGVILLFSAALLKAQLPCIPQSFEFRHLDRSSGLLSARINTMTQDQLGFWWLGMETGLQRFNGKSIQSFRHQPGDSTSLPDNLVLALHADKKNRIWVATEMGISRYLPENGGFKTYTIEGRPVDFQYPAVFLEDSRGDLWLVASIDYELFRLRAGSDTWERYSMPAQTAISGRNIKEDQKTGNIWVNYQVQGKAGQFGYIDRKTGRLNPGPAVLNTLVQDASHFNLDQNQGIWTSRIGKNWYPEFFFRYDIPTGQIQRFDIHHYPFTPPLLDKKHRVWFFDPGNKQFGFIAPGQGRPMVYCWPNATYGKIAVVDGIQFIYGDREGNIWIAESNDGVFVFNPDAPRFLPLFENNDGHTAKKIQDPLTIWESPSGEIWIGTYGSGTFVMDNKLRQKRKIFTPIPKGYIDPGLTSISNLNTIWALTNDQDGNIWAGCQAGVLMQLSAEGELLWKAQDTALAFQTVRSLARDSDGFIWIGAQGGILARIDPRSRNISRFETMSPYSKKFGRIYQVIPDKAGWLWVVYKDQILHYHTRTKSWDLVRFSKKNEIEPGTGKAFISGAVEWGKDSMLVYGLGIYWLDKKSKTLREVDQSRALPPQIIRSVIRSGKDLILIFSTGVARWSPQTGKVVNYSLQDGLPDNFSEVANNSYRLSDGRIVMGMDNEGVYVFHPERMRKADTRPPNAHIDGIWVKGQRILTNPYGATKNLRLRHSENFLTVAYACPTLRQQHHLRFRYRLRGYSLDWVDNGTKRSVELTALSPGRYVLEVQVRNREGLEALQAARLPIRVLPPWYLSWPALLVYAVLLSIGIYRLYRFQLYRRLEMAETRRIRELDAFKTQFYTNITHEFRTPITAIKGMAGQALDDPEKYIPSSLHIIQRNSDRLLNLVNQVLELAKLESGSLAVLPQKGDMVAYIKFLLENFDSLARTKEIALSLHCPFDALEMDFDAEKVQTALGNLLSNALRFTPAGGKVDLYLACVESKEAPFLSGTGARQFFRVSVRDTGPGIPGEELGRIFERYYQVAGQGEGGTGIGLTLARELARLMGGEITAEGSPGNGSTFSFWLPVIHAQDTPDLLGFPLSPALPGSKDAFTKTLLPNTPDEHKPVLLLVEDSVDILHYLTAFLEPGYRLQYANNGREGLHTALENIPDLIITDVMMPEMDGLEFCAAIKSNPGTSHIPLILLTAKAGMSSKVEGLNLGADDYLVKPFEKAELLARVRQLLEQRRRLQTYYLQRALAGTDASSTAPGTRLSHIEEAFLAKIQDIVETHYSDAEFSVGDLERMMGMSHTQFYLKFTALLGITAAEYLRKVRLQKAQELLKNPHLSISEIAYSVGYSDPAYFSKVFKGETGVSPNEWRRQDA